MRNSAILDRCDREDAFNKLLEDIVDDVLITDHEFGRILNNHFGCLKMYIETGCMQCVNDLQTDVANATALNKNTSDGGTLLNKFLLSLL